MNCGLSWFSADLAFLASFLGLTGYAANQADGRVLVVAHGPREAGEKLLELLESDTSWPPRPGRVDKVVADWSQPQERFSGFVER